MRKKLFMKTARPKEACAQSRFRPLLSIIMLICGLMAFTTNSYGTHFRGGTLTWQQAGGNSIRFTLSTAWRRGYFVTNFGYSAPGQTVNIGTFYYGDGSSATVNATVVTEDIIGDIINTTWTVTKSYSAAGTYVANALNSNARVCPNRLTTPTCNGANYNLQTRVMVGTTNNPPVSSFPTVINLPIGAPAATFTIPATDPDGDPVTFRLARTGSPTTTTSPGDTARESGLTIQAPPNFTLSSTGVITMNTIGRTVDSQYSVQVMVEDRNASTGAVKSKTPVDFLIRMVAASTPPIFTAPVTTSYTAPIGAALTFTVTATTTDLSRTVTLLPVSIPVGSSMSPGLPVTGSVGGSASSVFSWTPGSTQTGTFVITYVAQNDLGLQTFKSITITVPCALDFTSSVTSPTCNGANGGAVSNVISNYSSSTNLSYSWSGPSGFTATTRDISSVYGGNYTFSVNDGATGCVRTKTIVINQPSAISFSATATQPTCSYNTGSVTLASSGGTGTISYSGDATTGLTTGAYSYTATDANGCTATAGASITNPSAISFSATATQPTCSYNTGSVSLSATGGTGSISYSGDATTGLTTGSYSYTATDANGCTATAGASITNPSAISFSATATQPTCSYNTGSVSLSATGGTGSISYSGSATTGLTTGSYSYTATDANGCTATAGASIANPSAITYTSVTATNISCNNSNGGTHNNGTVTVNGATGGTGSLSYSWSNGATSNPATSLTGPATYSVTITDANGCTTTGSASVSQPSQLTASATATNVSCNAANGGSHNNGSISTSVSGGTASYSYTWSGGASGANPSGLGVGTYNLTVTDGNGCTTTASASVGQPSSFSCSIAVTPSNTIYTGGIATNIYLGYGPQSATLTASVSSGSGYTYSWSPSTRLSSSTAANPVFSPTVAGTYTYTCTATNSNGCSTNCTVTFCVVDANDYSSKGGSKVIICHIPPGNPSNPQQLSISTNAVDAHLTGHAGDHLGPCYGGCGTGPKFGSPAIAEEHNHEIMVYPNPTDGIINVEIPDLFTNADITIMDVAGRVIDQRVITDNKGGVAQFNLSNVAKGVYMVRINTGDDANVVKVIVK